MLKPCRGCHDHDPAATAAFGRKADGPPRGFRPEPVPLHEDPVGARIRLPGGLQSIGNALSPRAVLPAQDRLFGPEMGNAGQTDHPLPRREIGPSGEGDELPEPPRRGRPPWRWPRAMRTRGPTELRSSSTSPRVTRNAKIIWDVVRPDGQEVCFMPVTVGGGIRTLDDIRALLNAGSDKVSINSAAVRDPEFVRRRVEAAAVSAASASSSTSTRSASGATDRKSGKSTSTAVVSRPAWRRSPGPARSNASARVRSFSQAWMPTGRKTATIYP